MSFLEIHRIIDRYGMSPEMLNFRMNNRIVYDLFIYSMPEVGYDLDRAMFNLTDWVGFNKHYDGLNKEPKNQKSSP